MLYGSALKASKFTFARMLWPSYAWGVIEGMALSNLMRVDHSVEFSVPGTECIQVGKGNTMDQQHDDELKVSFPAVTWSVKAQKSNSPCSQPTD